MFFLNNQSFCYTYGYDTFAQHQQRQQNYYNQNFGNANQRSLWRNPMMTRKMRGYQRVWILRSDGVPEMIYTHTVQGTYAWDQRKKKYQPVLSKIKNGYTKVQVMTRRGPATITAIMIYTLASDGSSYAKGMDGKTYQIAKYRGNFLTRRFRQGKLGQRFGINGYRHGVQYGHSSINENKGYIEY